MGTEFLFGMMKKILEMTSGEISTTIGIHVMPLDCTVAHLAVKRENLIL